MCNYGCLQKEKPGLKGQGCERDLFDFEPSAYFTYAEINKNNK